MLTCIHLPGLIWHFRTLTIGRVTSWPPTKWLPTAASPVQTLWVQVFRARLIFAFTIPLETSELTQSKTSFSTGFLKFFCILKQHPYLCFKIQTPCIFNMKMIQQIQFFIQIGICIFTDVKMSLKRPWWRISRVTPKLFQTPNTTGTLKRETSPPWVQHWHLDMEFGGIR